MEIQEKKKKDKEDIEKFSLERVQIKMITINS